MEVLSIEEIIEEITRNARFVHSLRWETTSTLQWRQFELKDGSLHIHVGADHYVRFVFSDGQTSESLTRNDNALDLRREDMSDAQRMALVNGLSFEGQISNLQIMDGSNEEGLIHLRGDYRKEISLPAAALWPYHLEPDELDPPIDVEAEGTIDFWVDAVALRVIKIQDELRPIPDDDPDTGRTDAVVRATTVFSDFNEAELPE
jgi:hypothetical protein